MIIVQEGVVVTPKKKNNVVYLISKIETNEVVYVGKAVDFHRRVLEHKRVSKWSGNKFSILYNAFRKYGVDAFKFELFSCYESEQEALDMEVKLISIVKPRYNITSGGESGVASAEDWKKWFKGTKVEHKAVKALNLKTKEIFEFDSYADAARYVGMNRQLVGNIARGHRNSCNGWTFSNEDNPDWESIVRNIETQGNNVSSVKGTQLSTGETFLFSSMAEASRATGVGVSGISGTCKGKQKQSGGYHWEYMNG